MAVTYKDIDQLTQKSSVVGTEKLPVSDTEYITPSQIVANDQKFYFVDGSSSQAGNSASGSYLSTKWEGTIPGVTTLVNGLKIAYRIKTNTGVATAGAVLSIDGGTTYKPVVFNVNSVITTRYSVGSTILLTYNSTQTATAYLTSNTKSTVTGCWQIMDYDSNTNTQQRVYESTGNVEYPITTRYDTTTGSSYYQEYGRYSDSVTLNPSTNKITAAGFKVTNGTSSQFLKADGSLDSNDYPKKVHLSDESDMPASPDANTLYLIDEDGQGTLPIASASTLGCVKIGEGLSIDSETGTLSTSPPIVATSQPAGGFLPNIEYNLGTITGNVTFALASGVSGVSNKWYWCFTAGSTAPTITWPSGLLWPQPSAIPPTIAAGDEVEVEVKNGHIVALVFKPTS